MKMVARVFVLCCSVLAVTAVLASARPAPEVTQMPSAVQPLTRVKIGPQSASAACAIGVTGDAVWSVNYILPPQDGYFTLINPADCSGCAGASVIPTTAHVALNIVYACNWPVTVAVYGASGTASCYTPDLTNVIVAPTNYTLPSTTLGAFDFSFALPPGACINGPAFLKIEFQSPASTCNTSARRPRLLTTDGVVPCTSYNIYPGGADDLGDPLVGFPGNPLMWVDADCCAVVPTLPKSWGSLKLSYR